MGGLEQDGEAFDDRLGEAHVADITVIGALINVAFGVAVFLDGEDFRILTELDSLGPWAVKVKDRGRLVGIFYCELGAVVFDVLAVAGRKLGERVWNFAAVLELESHALVFDSHEGRLDFSVLLIGPQTTFRSVGKGCEKIEKGKESHALSRVIR